MEKKQRILVIEDDQILREEISSILRFEDFEVREAADGLSGFHAIQESIPDLILCDIMIPNLNGIDLLRKIRSGHETRLIPMVLISALAEKDNIRNGMEAGADDYLTKPFTREYLISAVRVRLDKARNIAVSQQEKLNELKEKIISIFPHELNTPLNGILGFSQLLGEQADSLRTDEIRSMAQCISDSGNRLLNLVRRFNFFINLQVGTRAETRAQQIRNSRMG
jgi:two-component system, sensor histidine kinase and response regulator